MSVDFMRTSINLNCKFIFFILCKSTTTADCHSSSTTKFTYLSNVHVRLCVWNMVRRGQSVTKLTLTCCVCAPCFVSVLSFNTFALNFIMFTLCLCHLPSFHVHKWFHWSSMERINKTGFYGMIYGMWTCALQ